ncbi:hypothetical protein C5Y96_22145 [Blastopirellula marina]|uniref:Uncharacterized protein n=2 Tax=Pirellulales TaxID=2691354 RepID=A0A2S8F1Y5_9BACT|nr:hypothetical protein C5Y96_22145 [Blastopirellula marina]RCS44509.1 hypothetical protein DTL36_22190 [Bremerella cremea]
MPPSDKSPCKKCGAMILPSTSAQYGGICAKCHQRPKRGGFVEIFDVLIALLFPLVMIAVFIFGIPLGHYLFFGGRDTDLHRGITKTVTLVADVPNVELNGKPARITTRYLVIETGNGETVWIPDENVAGVEFESQSN